VASVWWFELGDHRDHQRDGDQRRGAGTPPLPLTAASTSRSSGAATSSAIGDPHRHHQGAGSSRRARLLDDGPLPLEEDPDGRCRWWTFGGGAGNRVLAGLLELELGERVSPGNTIITFSNGAAENAVGIRQAIDALAARKLMWENAARRVDSNQRSRVFYFPADKDVDGSMGLVPDDDRHRVQQMFRLIFEAVEAVAPGLQVILIEHADLNEDWYRDAIVERWRGGLKLVPADWPRAGEGPAE
jgi:hypothetical protein